MSGFTESSQLDFRSRAFEIAREALLAGGSPREKILATALLDFELAVDMMKLMAMDQGNSWDLSRANQVRECIQQYAHAHQRKWGLGMSPPPTPTAA